jgi:hypothetical protein
MARATVAALLVVLAVSSNLLSVTASEPSTAGLVVQYGDGTRVYALVQFSEESLSSEELLIRTGLDVVVAPFGGMGAAVCSIDGEGCPSSRCWCQSYSNPSYFWHFYALRDGRWVEQLQGASARQISDGDVDGWLWAAGDTSLPSVTLAEIAAANGVNLDGSANTTNQTSPLDPAITAIFVPAGESGATAATAGDSSAAYVLFGGMLLAVLAASALIVVRNRASGAPMNESVDE